MNIPEWSFKAKIAKYIFFQQWNDVDIFIEDTSVSTKKIFKQLISRCLGDKYKINEIFPLGGKKAVVQACSKDQDRKGRPRVYIVDGDLDLILNKKTPKLKRLYSLPCYCVENILIDKNAIIEVLYEEHPSAEKTKLERELDFTNWVLSIEPHLINLFIDYAICYELNMEVQTVQYKVSKLTKSGDGLLDITKITLRCKEIEAEILKVISVDLYKKRKVQILKYLRSSSLLSANKIVSGKDYILPLLRKRMYQIAPMKTSNDCLNIRLAIHCDVSVLNGVCNCLKK